MAVAQPRVAQQRKLTESETFYVMTTSVTEVTNGSWNLSQLSRTGEAQIIFRRKPMFPPLGREELQ
jgi:hypothetical protein